MSQIRKLASQTAIYGLSSIVGRLLNYFFVPLYTRLFAPSEYGVVTELYSYVSFLAVILTYGMETGYFRFMQNENDKPKVFGTSMFALTTTSLIFFALISLFIFPVSRSIGYENHYGYILVFAAVIALDALTSVPFAKLRQENRPIKFVTIKLINIGTNIFLNLFFLVLCPYLRKHFAFVDLFYVPSFGVGYIFVSNLVASLLTLILFIPSLRKSIFIFDKELLTRMLKYSLPLLVVGLAGMVNETLDRVILKHFVTIPADVIDKNEYIMAQVGIYGANYKIAILMTLFIQTFRYASEPFYFAMAKEKNAKDVYADVMNYFVIFGLVIFLGVILYIDIIKFFIAESYYSGLTVVPVLLIANLFLGITINLSIWYKLGNQTKYGMYITLIGAFVTIVLNIILIPKIGYLGSAWATLICYLVMMILSYSLGQKYYPVNYKVKKFLIYFALAMLLFFVSIFVRTESIVINLFINTFLFVSFASFVFYKENLMLFVRKLKK